MIAPAEIVVRKLRPRNRPERASSRAPANNSCLTSKPERRLLCRAAEFAAEFPVTTEVERKIAERLLEDQRNVAWDVATEQFAPGTTVVDYLCALLLEKNILSHACHHSSAVSAQSSCRIRPSRTRDRRLCAMTPSLLLALVCCVGRLLCHVPVSL